MFSRFDPNCFLSNEIGIRGIWLQSVRCIYFATIDIHVPVNVFERFKISLIYIVVFVGIYLFNWYFENSEHIYKAFNGKPLQVSIASLNTNIKRRKCNTSIRIQVFKILGK